MFKENTRFKQDPNYSIGQAVEPTCFKVNEKGKNLSETSYEMSFPQKRESEDKFRKVDKILYKNLMKKRILILIN